MTNKLRVACACGRSVLMKLSKRKKPKDLTVKCQACRNRDQRQKDLQRKRNLRTSVLPLVNLKGDVESLVWAEHFAPKALEELRKKRLNTQSETN